MARAPRPHSFAVVAAMFGTAHAKVEEFVYPHLRSRLPPTAEERRPGSGKKVAVISSIYEVDTQDWLIMKRNTLKALAKAVEDIDYDYFSVAHVEPLMTGRNCYPQGGPSAAPAGEITAPQDSLRCRGPGGSGLALRAPGVGGAGPDGSLADADPRYCIAATPGQSLFDETATTTPPSWLAASVTQWSPTWTDDEELEYLIWDTTFCVGEFDTSLYIYPTPLNATFITGSRSRENERISTNKDTGVPWELHIVGSIPIEWANFFNNKFILNGSIPLPMYQPEIIDDLATETDVLNITIKIFGVRQRVFGAPILDPDDSSPIDYLPICRDPPVAVKGCFRIDHYFYEMDRITEYKMKNMVLWQKRNWTETVSAQPYPLGEFNVSQGPWPKLQWLVPPEEAVGPWRQLTFPQKESVFQEECKYGKPCDQQPLSPMPRYMHTSVLYETWSGEDVKRTLCNDHPECGVDCLTNLTCLGGRDFYQGNFYFRSSQFRFDDGGVVPFIGLTNQDCPRLCCKDRRLCLRVHDVMGYEVPLSAQMLLIFGGKTYVHEKDPADGRLVYHNCEQIPSASLLPQWRSCNELIVNDLWRYHVAAGKWEYIKPDSALSPTTGLPVGYPLARYGHAAVIVIDETPTEKRIFMYIYGGMGQQCAGGVCNDVWRYEIPWAAQAYYPKFPEGEWNRGNLWDRLKDCPLGGRYRHSMVVTTGQENIYVYGGQGIGSFYNQLLKYRVSTDLWEDLRPFGRVSLTRLMYDYAGRPSLREVPVGEYSADIDVECSNAWRFDGKWAHCQICPDCGLKTGRRDEGAEMPTDRGDFATATFTDQQPGAVDDMMVIVGGYRTTWGSLRNPAEECAVTTTTTLMTTTTVLGVTEAIVLTTPPPITSAPPTTAANYGDGGAIGVVGTFQMIGGVPTTTTVATTLFSLTTVTSTTTDLMGVKEITSTITSTVTATTSTLTTMTSTTTTTSTFTGTSAATLPPTSTITTTVAIVSTYPPVVHGGELKDISAQSNASSSSDSTEEASNARVGPEACDYNTYYFDDIWIYEPTLNRWQGQAAVNPPGARRGHSIIARRHKTNDTQLVMFGGHNQDKPMNDMWVLDLMRPAEDRIWTRIDPYIEGRLPPEMSFLTMSYAEKMNLIVVFGGLIWKETDLTETDKLRNIDRRCLKEAQGLPENQQGKSEQEFLSKMRQLCADSEFCCALTAQAVPPRIVGNMVIRTDTGALNLTAISTMCRFDCEQKAFFAEFYPIMSEGVWVFQTDTCPGDCSGNGYCDMSQCVCKPFWYGIDCSQPRCPGSTCYTHAKTKEQFCIDCSQHGRCINGECQCFPGWGYQDCSAPLCEGNCSSTPYETRGVCVDDFPVHQCHCFDRWSGFNCSTLLCLNDCSGRGQCLDGVCTCDTGFYGEDCSLFVFKI